MKIITLFRNEKAMLRRAANGNREAQRQLYEELSPKMLSVCRRYIRDLQYAEDVMIEGFVKVFKNLGQFRGDGSFEGWVQRIMIREAIDFLRRKQFVVLSETLPDYEAPASGISDFLEVQQIQALIDGLPEGYRMVFVLHAVEGYKHKEIASMLEISESTSKSQLFKARKMLQERLPKHQKNRYGTF